MATTTVQTVNISTIDEDGKQTTFNLDNPKENLTKNQVISAFQSGIDHGILISNYGSLIKSVGTVTLATSTKIELEGEPIYITPNSLEYTFNRIVDGSSATKTVSVTNGTIQSAGVTDLTVSSGGYLSNITVVSNFTTSTVTVKVIEKGSSNGTTYTGKLIIVIQGTSYSVPITITVN